MADSNGASLPLHSNRSVTPLGICTINRAEGGDDVLAAGVWQGAFADAGATTAS
ncbi:hypothetical protein [Caballeronia sp. GAWG1-1]|uniref:hypothetical protein n=1 Tax=Caballeronia sp. GAWG1-1 TaxID=2921742 RepID=UPI00202901B7|nr:hypothetical protein [Caballeronia sp. GAWG1-1]